MSQYDMAITGTDSGTTLVSALSSWEAALNSEHAGSTRPSYAVASMLWINNAATPWVLYMFDGTDDIKIGTINATTNVFVPSADTLSMNWCGTAGGTANALTLTPTPAITAYTAGMEFNFKAGAAANSTAATVSISGVGAIAIQVNGAACIGGEIEANKFYKITLDTATSCQLTKLGVLKNLRDSVNTARVSVTSAATTADIWGAAGNQIDWTGTTTCTGFPNAPQAGAERTLICAAAAPFTAGTNMLIDGVASGATLTLAANDIVKVYAVSTTQFRLTVKKYNGSPVSGIAKIQTISASVSGNALTISAPSAFTLDFRSTTLGDGTITTVSGTPTSLVVPSGASLGTINAVQSDLAVIVMNNADTLEYAVVNESGGVDLSETGLISTTAISATSTSSSVIYSTTARTNVAYRVVGRIRSTQATAGTWATAPSLIQGVGGQALTSMSSLGYGQVWQDLTGVGGRALGTTLYNTTGKPIMVVVWSGVAGASSGNSFWSATVGGVICNYGSAAPSASTASVISFIVPANQSYLVQNANGTVTIGKWFELR